MTTAQERAAGRWPSLGNALNHCAAAFGTCRLLQLRWGSAFNRYLWPGVAITVGFPDELQQRGAIDEPDVAATGEGGRLMGEAPGGHHEACRSPMCGHDAVQLTNHGNTDLKGFPMLALDERLLAIFR